MKYRAVPRFKRSYKRLKKKHYPVELIMYCLGAIIENDEDVMQRIKVHALNGTWKGYSEFHSGRYSNVGRDYDNWIVVYRVDNEELVLVLIDTGQHDILKTRSRD